MNLDIEDLLAGAIGSLIGRFLLFVAAVWIGCWIGLFSSRGYDVLLKHDYRDLLDKALYSPFYLFSMWGLLNFPFLLAALFYFMMSEHAGLRDWGIIAGIESLAIMAGWTHHHNSGWAEIGLSWILWAVLIGSLGSGMWFLRQMAHNRWAREITALNAENHYRIAEHELIEKLRIEREKQLTDTPSAHS